jgi:hypothetical protein
MNWKTFRKAITGALAAAVAAGATSLTAGQGWGPALVAATTALVGGFVAVYWTPANAKGPSPVAVGPK